MLPYLTPERYRVMGFGTEDQDDAVIRSAIMRATAAVDRYCSVPMVPNRYSFRGGEVVAEEHDFRLGEGSEQGTFRLWPRSTPVKEVTSLRAYVTNSHYITFTDLWVSKDNVQILSLTAISAGLYGSIAVPIMGLRPLIARMDYTYGHAFTSVDEVLEPDDGKTYRAQNQFWDASDVTVKVNDAVVATGFTIDRTEGAIVFADTQTADAVVTASYGYSLMPEVSQATGLTVAKYLGDRDLVEKGLSGLRAITLDDISLERNRRGDADQKAMAIPDEAKQLLDGLGFITAR